MHKQDCILVKERENPPPICDGVPLWVEGLGHGVRGSWWAVSCGHWAAGITRGLQKEREVLRALFFAMRLHGFFPSWG